MPFAFPCLCPTVPRFLFASDDGALLKDTEQDVKKKNTRVPVSCEIKWKYSSHLPTISCKLILFMRQRGHQCCQSRHIKILQIIPEKGLPDRKVHLSRLYSILFRLISLSFYLKE